MLIYKCQLMCIAWTMLAYIGKAAFTKKQADLFFPPDFNDDFPVAMQVIILLAAILIYSFRARHQLYIWL